MPSSFVQSLISKRRRLAVGKLITIEEAAALVRVPVATLRFWRQTGTGPRSARIGRRVMYREDDLNAWLDAQFKSDKATA